MNSKPHSPSLNSASGWQIFWNRFFLIFCLAMGFSIWEKTPEVPKSSEIKSNFSIHHRQAFEIFRPLFEKLGKALSPVALANTVFGRRFQKYGPAILSEKDAELLEATFKNFGPRVFVALSEKKKEASADFNGDKKLDLLVWTKLGPETLALKPEIEIVWPDILRVDAKTSLKEEGWALAITHGSKKDWRISKPIGVYLIPGSGIFEETESTEFPEITILKKKRGQENEVLELQKGDAIQLKNKQTTVILYWDGKTYQMKRQTGE